MMSEHKVCPWCGGKGALPPFPSKQGKSRVLFVICIDCNACGPEAVGAKGDSDDDLSDQAWSLWDRRSFTTNEAIEKGVGLVRIQAMKPGGIQVPGGANLAPGLLRKI